MWQRAARTPVGVSRIDPEAAYRLHTVSALSEGQPSEASKMVLRRLGLMDRFDKEPAAVLAELHQGLAPTGDEWRLFALADLSFLHGERTGDRAYYLASAVYAYALLFPGGDQPTPLDQSDPRLRLAYDLYNQGLAQGLAETEPASGAHKPGGGGQRGKRAEVRLAAGSRSLPFGKLDLTLDDTGLTWAGYPLEHFVSTTTLEVRGLRNRYRRPGLGAPLAASLADTAPGVQRPVGAERIPARTKVPVTALVRIDDPRASLASGRVRGRLELYAADRASTVTIDGRPQPLEADPTAALAYQLEGSPAYDLEITAFFRAGAFGSMIPRDRAKDGLFTLQPYVRGKMPVVLVHGTASSPTRWAELVNELLGDPRIRERYQIWLFMYDSGNPIGYSAGRLRGALTAAVQRVRPGGHGCGAAAHGRDRPQPGRPPHQAHRDRYRHAPVEQRDLEAVRLGQSASRDPRAPAAVDVLHAAAVREARRLRLDPAPRRPLGGRTAQRDRRVARAHAERRSSASSPRSQPRSKARTPRSPRPSAGRHGGRQHERAPSLHQGDVGDRGPASIPAHSIIPVKGTGPYENGNDGVVAYESAHLDWVASEKVVRWNHSCQGTPEAIEEIRRILYLHAAEADAAAAPPLETRPKAKKVRAAAP